MSMLAHAASATAAAMRSAARPSSTFLAALAPVTRRALSLQRHRGVHSSAAVRVESVSMVDEKEWLQGEGRAEAREHALRKRHQQAAAQKAAAVNDVGVGQSPQEPSAAAKPDDHQSTEPRSRSFIVDTSRAFLCLPFLALTMRNTQRSVPLNLPLLRSRAAFVLHALRLDSYALDVWVTTDATLRRLNRQYRQMDNPTDILSFPFQPLTPPPASVPPEQRSLPPVEQGVSELGQIVISAPYVLRDSAKMGQTVDQRLRTLIVHGVCHLLGYDHENAHDAELMEAEEARLLKFLDEHEATHPPQ